MKEWLKKYKHAWILSYLILYLAWFAFLEKTVTGRFHVVHMAVDDYIPFCEYFIIPYLLWFGYVAAAVIYFFFHNVSDYYKLCCFLFVGMTVFLVASTIYPNGHYLRPSVFRNDNIFTTLVQYLYATDTATNLFPSIHVYLSLIHILDTHQVKTLIASHVGLNKTCGAQYSAGELDLILTPQGTLAEQIRCGGAGLGGFLTPTGIGTIVAEGKTVVEMCIRDR